MWNLIRYDFGSKWKYSHMDRDPYGSPYGDRFPYDYNRSHIARRNPRRKFFQYCHKDKNRPIWASIWVFFVFSVVARWMPFRYHDCLWIMSEYFRWRPEFWVNFGAHSNILPWKWFPMQVKFNRKSFDKRFWQETALFCVL